MDLIVRPRQRLYLHAGNEHPRTGKPLQAWRDYFIFTGSIGATLLGLLFVSVSLNAEEILSGSHRHLKELAGQTFQSFILVVLVSLFFLFPGLNAAWNFALFGILGVYGIGWVAYRLFVVLRMPGRDYHWLRVIRRWLPAAIACSFLIYADSGRRPRPRPTYSQHLGRRA